MGEEETGGKSSPSNSTAVFRSLGLARPRASASAHPAVCIPGVLGFGKQCVAAPARRRSCTRRVRACHHGGFHKRTAFYHRLVGWMDEYSRKRAHAVPNWNGLTGFIRGGLGLPIEEPDNPTRGVSNRRPIELRSSSDVVQGTLHRAPVGQGPSALGSWLAGHCPWVLVWSGACYRHGVGGFVFNSEPSSPMSL